MYDESEKSATLSRITEVLPSDGIEIGSCSEVPKRRTKDFNELLVSGKFRNCNTATQRKKNIDLWARNVERNLNNVRTKSGVISELRKIEGVSRFFAQHAVGRQNGATRQRLRVRYRHVWASENPLPCCLSWRGAWMGMPQKYGYLGA